MLNDQFKRILHLVQQSVNAVHVEANVETVSIKLICRIYTLYFAMSKRPIYTANQDGVQLFHV